MTKFTQSLSLHLNFGGKGGAGYTYKILADGKPTKIGRNVRISGRPRTTIRDEFICGDEVYDALGDRDGLQEWLEKMYAREK